MGEALKINYSTNEKENGLSIGIAQNNKGFIRIYSLDGRDLSDIPIMNAQEYRGLISPKEIVDYMTLDRVDHKKRGLPKIVGIRDIKKVIEIEGINKSGYRIEDLEKVAETSKLVRNTSEYIKGKVKDESEYNQFNLVLDNIKTNLLELDFNNAYLFTEIPLEYCERQIWKNPGKSSMDFYKEAYRKFKDIRENLSGPRRKSLEKSLI